MSFRTPFGPYPVTDLVITGEINRQSAEATLKGQRPYLFADALKVGSMQKIVIERTQIEQMLKDDDLSVQIKFPNCELQAKFMSLQSRNDFLMVVKEIKGFRDKQVQHAIPSVAETPTPVRLRPKNNGSISTDAQDKKSEEKLPQRKRQRTEYDYDDMSCLNSLPQSLSKGDGQSYAKRPSIKIAVTSTSNSAQVSPPKQYPPRSNPLNDGTDPRTKILQHSITSPQDAGSFAFRSTLAPKRKGISGWHTPALNYVEPVKSSSYQGYRSTYRFESSAPAPQREGLRNLGNTCYLNAVLQALSAVHEFGDDLRSSAEDDPAWADGALVRCTLQILREMRDASPVRGPISPSEIQKCIAKGAPMFGSQRQQDAHEFLLEFMNQLHDELLDSRKTWIDKGNDPAFLLDLATQASFDSIVSKNLRCKKCNFSRDFEEKFRDFSLDFLPSVKDGAPLYSLLESYFAAEDLEATCEKCGCSESHMEKSLRHPPRTLVLHLKRFLPNVQLQRYDKRHEALDIPEELDLKDLCKSFTSVAEVDDAIPEQALKPSTNYRLRSIIAHDGNSPHSGHYVCYSRGSDGTWKLYDDSVVQGVKPDIYKSLGRRCYIAIYVAR